MKTSKIKTHDPDEKVIICGRIFDEANRKRIARKKRKLKEDSINNKEVVV